MDEHHIPIIGSHLALQEHREEEDADDTDLDSHDSHDEIDDETPYEHSQHHDIMSYSNSEEVSDEVNFVERMDFMDHHHTVEHHHPAVEHHQIGHPTHFIIEEPTPEHGAATFHGREAGYVYRELEHPDHARYEPDWSEGFHHTEEFGDSHAHHHDHAMKG